jgi:trk system potassium uptake protein TrkA
LPHLKGGVVIVGLGRFGESVAITLQKLGVDVLAIDSSATVVQRVSGQIHHVVQADGTSPIALRQLGVNEFERAVVAIASDIEASVLATLALKDLGIEYVWAKAVSSPHRRILEAVGAYDVVQPEHDMGERMAHQVFSGVVDYLQVDEDFALVEVEVSERLAGPTLRQAQLRDRFDVTVVCIKPPDGKFSYATPDTPLAAGDTILVAGRPGDLDRFVDRGA